MLDFKRINKPDFRYSLLYRYVQLIHNNIYYRRYNVVNKDNIPPRGEGFMVICNHQNGLNDALGILFSMAGRFPIFIARADIFKKEFVGKLLRFLKIMPAFRKRDVGLAGLDNNEIIFAQSARIINEGDIICLFPEAGHEDCHHLGTFKKGFARIAFRAVELSDYKLKLKILPLGNHYSNYFRMQGKLMINIGEPFEFTELYELHKSDPNRAQYLLAQKAAKGAKTDARHQRPEHYDEYAMLCTIYRDIYIRRRPAPAVNHDQQVQDFAAAVGHTKQKLASKARYFAGAVTTNPGFFPTSCKPTNT
jgi:1-acyl-sn-glycerol-3-phosphate acyltransferase